MTKDIRNSNLPEKKLKTLTQKKEEKRSESDLKKRLLEKQKAKSKKTKSTTGKGMRLLSIDQITIKNPQYDTLDLFLHKVRVVR